MTNLPALQYLDRALETVQDMGLKPEKSGEDPIGALLDQITELDKDKVTIIARTLAEASTFNEIVRNEIAGMKIGERYDDVVDQFNSIRDDAKMLVDQLEDGKLSTWERANNIWMKVARGDVATRFDDIQTTYLDVAADSKDQIKREQRILSSRLRYWRWTFSRVLKHGLELRKKLLRKHQMPLLTLLGANRRSAPSWNSPAT
jgi:predicted ribosome quality control (RQC) complex YloA/Tae2 family protein